MRRHLLGLFISAAALALGLASSGLSPRQQQQRVSQSPPTATVAPTSTERCAHGATEIRDDDTRVEDRYYNYAFGFSVDLPAGMVGARSPAPMPNHGFGVDLNNPQSVLWIGQHDFPRSYLYIDASYDSALLGSLDEAVKYHFGFPASEGTAIRILRRTRTRLAGLRAVHVIARYVDGVEPMISNVVIAFRKENDEEVIYTIAAQTPEADYENHKAIVVEMQKTWCLQPLP